MCDQWLMQPCNLWLLNSIGKVWGGTALDWYNIVVRNHSFAVEVQRISQNESTTISTELRKYIIANSCVSTSIEGKHSSEHNYDCFSVAGDGILISFGQIEFVSLIFKFAITHF